MSDGPESEEEMMPGIVALRWSGSNHSPDTETLHHETVEDARERSVPYEGMAVTDGSEADLEVLGPVSAPTQTPSETAVVQASQQLHDALRRLPLTLGS